MSAKRYKIASPSSSTAARPRRQLGSSSSDNDPPLPAPPLSTSAANATTSYWNPSQTSHMQRWVAALVQHQSRQASSDTPLSRTDWQRLVVGTSTNQDSTAILVAILACSKASEVPLLTLKKGQLLLSDTPTTAVRSFWSTWEQHASTDLQAMLEESLAPQVQAYLGERATTTKAKDPTTTNQPRNRLLRAPNTATTGATVEERVRQRAAATTQQRPAQTEKRAAAHQYDSQQELLQAASYLWSHGRSLQKRQVQTRLEKKTSQPAATSPRVVMTLQDVVRLWQQSGHWSRRACVEQLHVLCDRVPEWLVLSPPHATHPQATLWILSQPDWNSLAAQIQGQAWTSLPAPLNPAAASGESTTATAESSTTDTAASPPVRRSLSASLDSESSDESSRKRPRRAAAAGTKRYQDDLSSSSLEEEEEEAAAPVAKDATATSTAPPAPASPSSRPTKKAKPTLRVNPHLILSNADYTGGECLSTQVQASPRGLWGLFHKLQAGQRI